MAIILCIETSASMCSVALFNGGELLHLEEENKKNSHAELLLPFIENCLAKANKKRSDIDAVAISEGPGSYTGLRIGVSTAKGLCYALSIPLIAVDTLTSMVHAIDNKNNFDIFIPMQDARRMEVYTCMLNQDLQKIQETNALVVEESSFDTIKDKRIAFFGDGAMKCMETFSHLPQATFFDTIVPSAKYMGLGANKKLEEDAFEDVAYFTPFYLKSFVAGTPKKLV